MHLLAASSASLYIVHSWQIVCLDHVGGRPCSYLILHLSPWHGLVVFCFFGVGSCCCCLFRFLLLERFLFCFFGGGIRLSLLVRIVLVIVVCIAVGCWCSSVNNSCQACLNAAVMVCCDVGMCHSCGMRPFICLSSFAWCL